MNEISAHTLSLDAAQAFLAISRQNSYGLMWKRPRRFQMRDSSLDFLTFLRAIRSDLADLKKAVSVIDIPICPELSSAENTIWSTAIAMAVSNLIVNPLRTPSQSTIFTTLGPLEAELALLLEAGLSFPSRPVPPSFQVASVFSPTLLYMPEHMASYTLHREENERMEERQEYFYWVPVQSWQEWPHYFKALRGQSFLYRLRRKGSRLSRREEELVLAPLSPPYQPDRAPFLNLDIIASCPREQGLISDLRASIARAPSFKIPFRSRRLLIYRNARGLHDSSLRSFQEKSSFIGVDKNGHSIPFRSPETVEKKEALGVF